MPRDDLESYIVARSKRDPELPNLIRAAEQRKAIARQLAAQRRKAAQSQTAVAARMGTSASIVSRIEQGGNVSLETLQKYAAAIGRELQIRLVAKAA